MEWYCNRDVVDLHLSHAIFLLIWITVSRQMSQVELKNLIYPTYSISSSIRILFLHPMVVSEIIFLQSGIVTEMRVKIENEIS
jgi:hypothetical protein